MSNSGYGALNPSELLEMQRWFVRLSLIAMHVPILDLNPCSFNQDVAKLSAEYTPGTVEMMERLGGDDSSGKTDGKTSCKSARPCAPGGIP